MAVFGTGMDNILLEMNSFNWFLQSFVFVHL